MTLESLLVFFIFCDPNDNLEVGEDSSVFILVYFGEASYSLLLAILATYSGNANWWKKAGLHPDGGNT